MNHTICTEKLENSRNSEVSVSKCTHIDSTFASKLMHSVSKLVLSNAANVANGLRFLEDPLQRSFSS
jgi:hypothetical protein